jgi:15-cis-phytoene synthase
MSDDPLQRGTPPGSLRYFAVLFAPEAVRPLLHALYAFEAEIRDTRQASAHEVAHTRLQYWRAEVDRLVNGQPAHPVTRALLPLRDGCADLSLLHEVLVAADVDLARIALANESEVTALAYRSTGSVQTLAAAASRGSGPLPDAEREFARRLGRAIAGVETLRDLRADVAAGRLRLPLDELERAGVDPARLLDEPAPAALVPLLSQRQTRLRTELESLPGLLNRAERSVQRHGLVLAMLHVRLLDRIDHARGLARVRAAVPPWSSVWTSWRTAVRHA